MKGNKKFDSRTAVNPWEGFTAETKRLRQEMTSASSAYVESKKKNQGAGGGVLGVRKPQEMLGGG